MKNKIKGNETCVLSTSFNIKKVIHGVCAEIISGSLTFPLNTLKTNLQIGNIVCSKSINVFRGYKWFFLSETVNAVIFYSLFEGYNYFKNINPLARGIVSSGLSICCSYPFNMRRKISQIGKDITIGNTLQHNYNGLHISLFNSVPGVTVNYSTREILSRSVPENYKIAVSLFSTALSIALTHPLDTLSTCISTRTPINIYDVLKYRGFRQRFFEKNLTIGSKMLLLDIFDKHDNNTKKKDDIKNNNDTQISQNNTKNNNIMKPHTIYKRCIHTGYNKINQ